MSGKMCRPPIFLLLTILLSCQGNPKVSAPGFQSGDDSGKPVLDILHSYLENRKPVSSEFYLKVFGGQISNEGKMFISEIREPVGTIHPVITTFNTWESDREVQFLDLHLFDEHWKLKLSKSMKYEIAYDLFVQDFQFLNDTTIQVVSKQGLGYDTDDHVKSVAVIRLSSAKLLDTMTIQVDTVRFMEE